MESLFNKVAGLLAFHSIRKYLTYAMILISSAFIVSFEHISHLFLILLLTLGMYLFAGLEHRPRTSH